MNLGPPDWNEAKKLFEWDGSLVDIFVARTTLTDWANLLFLLRQRAWPYKYQEEDIEMEMPSEFVGSALSRLLMVQVGHLSVNCHFFDEDEIEFDIDTREVKGPADYDELLGFMRMIGASLGKPVCLAAEGFHENPCFCVYPKGGDN